MDQAVTHASQELLNIRSRYRELGWHSAVGSSGSIKAVANVLASLRITDGSIDLRSMRELRRRLIDMGNVRRLADLGCVPTARAFSRPALPFCWRPSNPSASNR